MTSAVFNSAPNCGAPIMHDPHGFIVTGNNIAYTIICPGKKANPHGGPQGIVGATKVKKGD